MSSNDLNREFLLFILNIYYFIQKRLMVLKKVTETKQENNFSRWKTELWFSRVFVIIILKMIKLIIYFSCFLYFCSLMHINKWARNQQNYQRKSKIRGTENHKPRNITSKVYENWMTHSEIFLLSPKKPPKQTTLI